jgi:hypothetical protein
MFPREVQFHQRLVRGSARWEREQWTHYLFFVCTPCTPCLSGFAHRSLVSAVVLNFWRHTVLSRIRISRLYPS